MKRRADKAGFTLMEIMIAIFILSLIMVGIFESASSGQVFTARGMNMAYFDQLTASAVNSLAHELMNSSEGTILTTLQVPGGPGSTLTESNAITVFSFTKVVGYDPDVSETLWSTSIVYTWVVDPSDATIGSLRRTQDGQEKIIMQRVVANGFRLAKSDSTIYIELQTKTTVQDYGDYFSTQRSSVTVRN